MDPATAPSPAPSAGRRYAPFAVAYGLLTFGLLRTAARRDQLQPDALELTEAAFATFFLARAVAREKIGAVVRDPFVEPAPGTDPADAHGEAKQPAGSGLRYGIGELLTCTRCLGPWAASLLTIGHVAAPRHTRVATRVMALAGINTLLHALFAVVTRAANRD